MNKKNSKTHNQKEEVVRMKNGRFVKKSEYDKIVKNSSKKKNVNKKSSTAKAKKKEAKLTQTQEIELVEKEMKKAIFDYEKEIENTTVLNMPKEESSNKVEDTFKVKKKETKKVETPKKKVNVQKVKETLNKPIYVSKKTQEEKEEEKKIHNYSIIITIIFLLYTRCR
ncbi:MAG: hypothetical protein J6A17_02115 [Bacilli bacterium]|nr:hypothetical protein [Bacilli bacterium]